MGKKKPYYVEPTQWMCIDGDMHKVAVGQFIKVDDYEKLRRKHKKLLKLCHINGIFEGISPAKKAKEQKIFGGN